MSDNEATKGKASSWTDRERLAYLVSVIEHSETKLNFKTSPLPAGRTQIACERMFGRLKNTLKAELDTLRTGAPMPSTSTSTSNTSSTTAGEAMSKKGTSRKRKAEAGKTIEGEQGSPVKKGRGRKASKGAEIKDKIEDVEADVKSEVKEEEEEEEI